MSALARFHDLKISTKISAGFGVVLLATAGVAYCGVSSLAALDRAIGLISQRVAVADLAQTLQKEFSDVRRQAREYSLSGDEDYIPRIAKEQKEVQDVSARALVEIKTLNATTWL